MSERPLRARHAGLDALRGLLMVTVIIGHFPTSGQGTNPFGPLPEWVYFFHIPLFLALSCLFVKPFTRGQLRQRAAQLLVPYAAWMLLTHAQSLRHPGALLTDMAMGNWDHVLSILWFLPALFTTNLLMGLWRSSRTARSALALLAAGTLLFAPRLAPHHGQIPFGLDVALFLLPFIWGIQQVWHHREAMAECLGRCLLPTTLVALLLGGLLVRTFEAVKTHSAYARRVDFAQFSVPQSLPGYLGMFLMGGALVLLFSRWKSFPWLAAIGRHSMPIFLLHYLLLIALSPTIGWAGDSRPGLLLYALGTTALIIAACMLTAQVLTRISPRFRWIGLSAP